MRRQILKTAGILGLGVVLSVGMAGCGIKENKEPVSLNILEAKSYSGNGIEGSNVDGDNNDAKNSSAAEGSNDIKNSSEADDGGSGEGKSESVYFDGADLNGRVLEFSDTGFTMTPVHTVVYEDGTRSSWEAAPGKENEEDNIYVTYTEDTVFEVVYFSMSLQKETSREDADKSRIKKQTMVYIFGSSPDERNWTADKVLIQLWD